MQHYKAHHNSLSCSIKSHNELKNDSCIIENVYFKYFILFLVIDSNINYPITLVHQEPGSLQIQHSNTKLFF